MTSARMETDIGRQPRRPHPSSCWTARSTSDGGTPPTERSQASTTPEGTWCPTSLVSISANSPGDAPSFSRASRNWLRARAEKSSGWTECDPSASSCCMREAVPRWRCAISASRSAASMRWPASGRAEMNRTASAYARSNAVNAVPRPGAVFTSSPPRLGTRPARIGLLRFLPAAATIAGVKPAVSAAAAIAVAGASATFQRSATAGPGCSRRERGHGAARPCAGPAPAGRRGCRLYLRPVRASAVRWQDRWSGAVH